MEGNPTSVFTPAQKTFMKWTPGIKHKMYMGSQLVTDNFGWWICQMYSSSINLFHCLGLGWPDWSWGSRNGFQGIRNVGMSRWWWNIFLLIGMYPAAYNIQLNSFFLKESNNTAIVKFNVSRKISSMGGPTLKKKKKRKRGGRWVDGRKSHFKDWMNKSDFAEKSDLTLN